MKQNDLQRMFQVIQSIDYEGLDNTQYHTKEISSGDWVNTTLYLGTVESRDLTEGYYIFIWMDLDSWLDLEIKLGSYGSYPKPDHLLHTYGDTSDQDQIVFIYKFNKQ